MLFVWVSATAVAARVDTPTLAAHQVANQVFLFLALTLDALAIPAQSLVAGALGAGDLHGGMRAGPFRPRPPPWSGRGGAGGLMPSSLGCAKKFLDRSIIAQGDEGGTFALTPMITYLLATAGFFCMLMYTVTQGAFHDLNAPSRAMFENELERQTLHQ